MELSDFASVALYLAVFLTAIALAYIGQKKNNKTLCVLAILLPVIIAGFRYSAGTDSITYRNFYTEVGNEDISKTVDRLNSGGLEPFLILFSVVGNALHLPASFLFICFALITAVFLYATTRLFNKERAWLYYGMLLLIVFPESLNMMRQVAAISVQAYALVSIFKAKRNNVRTHWSGMIALAALSACSVKEDRAFCPAWCVVYSDGYVAEGCSGNVTCNVATPWEDIYEYDRSEFSRFYTKGDLVLEVPRNEKLYLDVFCGVDEMDLNGSVLTIPMGFCCDCIYSGHGSIIIRGEEGAAGLPLNKDFALLEMKVAGEIPDEPLFDFRILGNDIEFCH